MRMIALDVGDRKIGIAASDMLGIIAQPVETLWRKGEDKDIQNIVDVIRRLEAEIVVIGLPRNMNGSIGPQAQKVQAFGDLLATKIDIPIAYWDERLTSIAAEKMLINANQRREKRKQVIDQVAAVYILQGYMERNKSREDHSNG